MNHCLNCEQNYSGNYCSNCGQKSTTHRLSIKSVFHDLQHALFHLDRGIFKNIISIRSPRKTVMSYIDGKRGGFFNPVMFFLISLGLMIYLNDLLYEPEEIVFNIKLFPGSERSFEAGYFFNHYLNYFFFCSCFVFAVPSLWVFKKETGYNYAEQVMAMVFILGYVNVAYLPFLFLSNRDTYPVNWFVLVLIYTFSVLVFYRNNIWLTMIKSLVTVFLQVVLFFLFTLVVGITASMIMDMFNHAR